MKTKSRTILNVFLIVLFFAFIFQDSKADYFSIKKTSKTNSNPKISKDCKFNGKKLYGKVQFVEAFPDIKVQIVDAFPDINVQLVDAFPDQCGRWQIVTAFPDLKVQIVDAFPDIRVRYVKSFPGVNN